MSVGSNLKALIGDAILKQIRMVTVVGLATDAAGNIGQVIVSDGTTQWPVAALSGYQNRQVGDVVLVLQLGGGTWLALGSPTAAVAPITTVMYGNGNPVGTGWRKAAGSWLHTNPDGSDAIYYDMTSAAPAPVTIGAADVGSWTGAIGNRGVAQSSPTVFAAWYYGTSISAACASKTATAMRVRIFRDQSSGGNASMPLKLALHNSPMWGQPTLTNQWDTGLSLALGQYQDVDLPGAWISALAAGTAAKGIAAYGEDLTQAMTYLPQADLTITFG